jgi:hypothetical protein
MTPTFVGVRSRARVMRARSALQRGSIDAANRELKRAERAIVTAAGPLDAARIALVRAELTGSKAQREQILAPAIATFTELGQRAELRRAETLLQ